MANPFAKTRTQDEPYAIYEGGAGFRWLVLKTYKIAKNEAKDPYARWLVAATSDMMHEGSYEMGDTYAKEIRQYGRLVSCTPEWKEAYHG